MTALKAKLYDNQKFNHNELIKKRRALLVDKAGNGKCKGGSARVQTSKGLLRFDELLKDAPEGVSTPDEHITVSTRKGAKKVLHFYKESNCNLNYLTLSNGITTTGTDDHPMLVLKDNIPTFTKTSDIEIGDIICFSKDRSHLETESDTSLSKKDIWNYGHKFFSHLISNEELQEVFKASFDKKEAFVEGLISARDTSLSGITIIRFDDSDIAKDIASIIISIGKRVILTGRSIIMEEGGSSSKIPIQNLGNSKKYPKELQYTMVPRERIELAPHGHPLRDLLQYNFCTVSFITNRVETVYDLTVEDVHEFISDGIINHNTLSCLAAFATLKKYKKLDLMIVLTPLNAYNKLVWKADASSKTFLKSVDLAVIDKHFTSNPTNLKKIVDQFDVIYAKHTHVKNKAEVLQWLVA